MVQSSVNGRLVPYRSISEKMTWLSDVWVESVFYQKKNLLLQEAMRNVFPILTDWLLSL